VDINRPALAKATNGWLALALYLLSLEEETPLAKIIPTFGVASAKLAEVTKALTKTPGESLLQYLTAGPFPEPIAYGAPPFYAPSQQQPRREKKGVLGAIKEFFLGEE
jgi:hypothetical protein